MKRRYIYFPSAFQYTQERLLFKEKAMKELYFDFEKEYLHAKTGDCFVVGVDEAGRGPLAGPVVAACAWYKDASYTIPEKYEKEFLFIRDSKTVSEKKREHLYDIIVEYFDIGVGIMHQDTIDRINILEATFLAMKEAVSDLRRKHRNESKDIIVFVDGNKKIPNFSVTQEAIIGGDKVVKSIAAASIIAKVTRDRIMNEYDAQYPQYGFAKHKGYGTKIHMDALQKYGPTPIHRLSFAPVSQARMWFKELGIIPEE